ncbi:MAG: S8 family serine peptidase [Bacteroidota bacterium]|nr:MAG: S8 family serine peptidase [Bacteroidota bacterium]
MRRILLLYLIFSGGICLAQTREELQKIREKSQPEALAKYAAYLKTHYTYLREYGLKLLQERGLPLTRKDSTGRTSVYHYYDTTYNTFIYVTNSNANSATTIGVPALRQNGGLGLNLRGQGMKIGIWEADTVMNTHPELLNRVMVKDNAYWSLSAFNLNPEHGEHATHVAGTIAATGLNPNAMGMAPEATLWANDFIDDINEMANQSVGSVTGEIGISNHSYGTDLLILTPQDRYIRCGKYTNQSKAIDSIITLAPYYLPVLAAGNYRNDNISVNGYDLITDLQCSKMG